MTITVCIPLINGLREAMPALALLKVNTTDDVEWMIIDNGSTESVEKYIMNYIKPKKLNYIRNEDNPGLIKNNQFAYENTDSDIIIYLHADTFIYEKNWNRRIEKYFEEIPNLGMAGLFGAQGCGKDGGRVQKVESFRFQAGLSNMVEAEIHGRRLHEPYRACAIYDSFGMMCSRKMLNATKGFDMNYKYHHYYDRDLPLESLRHGFKNIVVNIYCHHVGNIAASTPLYQEWQKKTIGNATDSIQIHNMNKEYFMKKWDEVLPLYVNKDFTFLSTDYGDWRFTGDKIVGYKL